ncbi:MAG: RagB/SusD family nutrient uptake outer membrane protein [Tannerellaceae bacterium]|nr:RagB/SusD family nutrient uptake outer membrane protein [Tannerellaceae bacterium]
MKSKYIKSLFLIIGLSFFIGCSESWLEPEPLSFFEPDETLSTQEGLESALTTCARQLRYYYMSDDGPLLFTEMNFSDMGVSAISNASGSQDMNTFVTPTSDNYNLATNKINWAWSIGYQGISFANVVITRIADLDLEEDVRNQMLSRAYFERAYRYYHLVFQFGDIPFLSKEVSSPKLDFRSVKMEVIIEQMIKDLEFAVEHISERDDYGKPNKGACRMLLIKFYMAAGEFDKAIAQADALINNSGYELMEETFGTFENPHPAEHPVIRNVIWDLHRPVNKAIPANKEGIMLMVNRYDNSESRLYTKFLRNTTPFWANGDQNSGILTPLRTNSDGSITGGIIGMSNQAKTEDMDPSFIDQRAIFGRGEAFSRPTYYAEKGMWTDENDLRHSRESGNWFVMENLKYNNPALKDSDPEYYNQPVQKYMADGTLLCKDTIRCWFDWPYYKLWIHSPQEEVENGFRGTTYVGGPGDWYLYRLAEAYLLRAEAYYWTNQKEKAADDVNRIRNRANCSPATNFNASTITLDVIMDERARELMFEELRHVELVRVSYIKANQEGIYNSPADLSKDSFWWSRIERYNNYYNKGVHNLHNDYYIISPYHIFWPLPQNEINANLLGTINQNYGYSGYENNITPISSLAELEESGQ